MNFYRYLEQKEPDEIDKLSVNNHEVYVRVQEEKQKHCIPDYDEHVWRERDASEAIHMFRQKMLDEIEKFVVLVMMKCLRLETIMSPNQPVFQIEYQKVSLYQPDPYSWASILDSSIEDEI